MSGKRIMLAGGFALVLAGPSHAESFVSLYSGLQGALSSDVSGEEADGTPLDFTADWEGRSAHTPRYYGMRYTSWWSREWGWSLDFTHVKVYADDDTLARSGFDPLELTNGVNVLTLDAMRRFPRAGRATPYLGGGVGISYPSVETRSPGADRETFEYQFGGPAAELRAGVDWRVSRRWSLFAEYEVNYLWLNLDMRGGGALETNLFTQAANFGGPRR